jgi:hypothetical protein
MLLLTILIAALLCVQHAAGDDCTIGDNICTATCGETKIDISPIKFPVTFSADDGNYVVDLCKGTTCGGDSADTPNSTVCLQSNSLGKVNCGQASADTMTWTLYSTNPMNFTIIYGGGDCDGGTNCKSSVFTFSYAQPSDLQCGANVNFTGTDNTIYSFSVTANLCDTDNVVGVIGLVLIALAIIAVLIYITAGVLFNAFYKGAVGKEIIPNYNFWIDLPFLIKDGFLFVFYTPCQACRKTSDYEKI